jgi:hypothetical protein
MLVETSYAANGRKSSVAYDHFSLLRTLKDGFGLPCLNQACDATSLIMNDMFGGKQARVGKASSANAVTRFRRAGRRCDRTRDRSRRRRVRASDVSLGDGVCQTTITTSLYAASAWSVVRSRSGSVIA